MVSVRAWLGVGHAVLEILACFESDHRPLWDGDVLQGFGRVASDPRLGATELKGAKIAHGDVVPLRQMPGDLLKHSVHHVLNLLLGQSGFCGQGLYEVSFRYGSHSQFIRCRMLPLQTENASCQSPGEKLPLSPGVSAW